MIFSPCVLVVNWLLCYVPELNASTSGRHSCHTMPYYMTSQWTMYSFMSFMLPKKISQSTRYMVTKCWCPFLKLQHDDVIKSKDFPRHWPFVRGIHRSTVNPLQRPVTLSFDIFFDIRLNKRLSKQSRPRWFETPSPSRSLWRHSNEIFI